MLTFLTLYTFKAETNKQQKGFFYYFLFCYQAFFFLNIFHPRFSRTSKHQFCRESLLSFDYYNKREI